MPVGELAATILPLFSHSAHEWEGGAVDAITKWCKTGSYGRPTFFGSSLADQPFDNPDFRAVAEAMQVLEHAGLIMRSFRAGGMTKVGLTRLGWQALQTKTVRQHLGLSDTPPQT